MSANQPRMKQPAWLLLTFAVLLLPLCCFFGYGSDNDTYQAIGAGLLTWKLHRPVTSRVPGYWVYEAITWVLVQAGGHFLTNLVTLAIACLVLWRFYRICIKLQVRFPALVTGSLACIPVFAIAACSTDDYLWSLLGLVLFIEFILANRFLLAILAGTCAFAIRGTNCVVIAGILGGLIASECLRQRKVTAKASHALLTGIAIAALGCLPFIATYRLYGASYFRTNPNPELWTMQMRAGRFFYKGILSIGLLAWLTLVLGIWIKSDAPPLTPDASAFRRSACPLLVGAIAANVLLFFDYPLEISYLLPALLCMMWLLGCTLLAHRRWLTVTCFFAVLSANFVTFQLARPDTPDRAASATFQPAIVHGQLIKDIEERYLLRTCSEYPCWLEKHARQ